jgi:hypothetical protein
LGEVRLDLPPVFRWFHFINTNYPILGSKRFLQVLQFYVLISNFNTSGAIIPAIPRNKWLQTKEVHHFVNMDTHNIHAFEQNNCHTPILCIWKARWTMFAYNTNIENWTGLNSRHLNHCLLHRLLHKLLHFPIMETTHAQCSPFLPYPLMNKLYQTRIIRNLYPN